MSKPFPFLMKIVVSGVVDDGSAVFRFHVSLSSVAAVLLHDEILALSECSVTRASLRAMRQVANDFFSKLGHFAVSGYGNKDFQDAKQVFLNACQHNHLRYV